MLRITVQAFKCKTLVFKKDFTVSLAAREVVILHGSGSPILGGRLTTKTNPETETSAENTKTSESASFTQSFPNFSHSARHSIFRLLQRGCKCVPYTVVE
jgi:hypothetical protein